MSVGVEPLFTDGFDATVRWGRVGHRSKAFEEAVNYLGGPSIQAAAG